MRQFSVIAFLSAAVLFVSPLAVLADLEIDFETYDPALTLREQGWGGSLTGHGPQEATVYAPMGTGNDSNYAMSPVPNDPETDYKEGYTMKAWKYVEAPSFATDDVVCYSVMFRGTSGGGIMPVNTDGGTANLDEDIPWYRAGPYFYSYWSKLRLRASAFGGDNWQATNLIGGDLDGSAWYEAKMVIDQRRDIDTNPEAGSYGVAHAFIRNVTEGETDWTKLVFDNTATDGVVEAATQVPTGLSGNHPVAGPGGHPRNPSHYDGWHVYEYSNGHMHDNFSANAVILGDFDGNGAVNGLDIPGFKAALADSDGWWAANGDNFDPDLLGDFDANGAFNGLDIPGFKNALAGTSVPEPATLLLLTLGALAGIRRR